MEQRTAIQLSNNLTVKAVISKQKHDLLKDMVSVFSELDRERTIISIPERLAGKIREKIKGRGISD